ncbi:patatin-like protein [Sphingomonas psychrotolerans]|uniref:Patatin-like protein n=1 Tax=Sphingomonas psychrotolerans TaxID=1327635 RepID=A0ABU3N386_9SPHN|nr:patatin-like protein [Sphingomonas psychrotolerans]MDT8757951.1 patatin-like protein [Sphingomonas psychrotolerans]
MSEARDKELRLALVCYGGISLAVYMHGITKEIWRLAKASCAAREGEAGNGVYRQLLDEIRETSGINLRVLVDILSGASAGGINAIFLAQAIATGQSLDPLTDMWMDHADVEALIEPRQAPSHRFAKIWATPIAWLVANRSKTIDETVEVSARDEVRLKLERFVRSRWFEPPFGGKRLLGTLMDAFEAMASGPAYRRLLPQGQPLDLFVTVTDFRGHAEELRLNSPPRVVETEHRLVFSFTDHGDTHAPFAKVPELAFAARATSSFPGAFPPFTIGEMDSLIEQRGAEWPDRDRFLEHVMPEQWADNRAKKAVLIDGSVLANAPFRPAIDALRERPARRQVDRRFVYIDPFPNFRFDFYGDSQETPGFFQTIIGSLSELPREQPIRDNLEAIAERSEKIERMLSIIGEIRTEVETQVEALFGYTLWLDYPTPKRLATWRRRAQVAAAAKAGYGHTAYGLLKVQGTIDRTARLLQTIGDRHEPERLREIREAIALAVRAREGDRFGATLSNGASPQTLEFLRAHDLGFRIRRLRLLARRLTEIDLPSSHAELLPMREAIYESLAAYLELKRSDTYADLRGAVRDMTDDAGPILDLVAERMQLKALDQGTDARLSDGFSALSKELRRPMLLAHLGFPFFDIATLPLLQGEGMDEFDPIRVDRISPDDATTIRAGGAEATLKGIQFNSFGAFFSRAYRENDYLWGRLHGADRLIDIVLSSLPFDDRLPETRVAEIKRHAFHAILDEEEGRLTSIPGLFAELRNEIDKATGEAPQ